MAREISKNGETSLTVRFVADTDARREKGLMHAAPLAKDEAVLFVFARTGQYAFWNKNVSFPLSLAFLNEHGVVVDTKDMEAQSTKVVAPDSSDVRFVVEASHGTFDRLGVTRNSCIRYHDGQLFLRGSTA